MLPCSSEALPSHKTLHPQTSSALPALGSVGLLDQSRRHLRYLHYSRRAKDPFVLWCWFFGGWHGLRNPAEMGGSEVEAFLDYIAADWGLALSSHRQASSALLLLLARC